MNTRRDVAPAEGCSVQQLPQIGELRFQRPRVVVVDSRSEKPGYARLDECAVDVMAVLPSITLVNLAYVANIDVVIVGSTETALLEPSLVRSVIRLTQRVRLMGVAPTPSAELAAYAARIGFHGLVASDITPDAFDRSVRALVDGECAFPRTAMTAMIRLIRATYRRLPKAERPEADRPDEVALTPRQRQIVDLLARGANDQEIAAALHISASTVQKHVQNALRRTNTKTRSHLTAALGSN